MVPAKWLMTPESATPNTLGRDVARRRIEGSGRTFLGVEWLDAALHGYDELRAEAFGPGVHRGVHVIMKNDLRDPFAVAQVNEDHATEIAAAMNPSHQNHALADVGGAQLSARMGAA